MTDKLHKNPESCTGSDTPETDAYRWNDDRSICGWGQFAEKLERERDEARFDLAFRRDLYKLQEERVKKLEAEVKLWKENATSNKHVSNFVERERDEAVNACHIWQRGHSKLVADRDDWKRLAVEQEKEIEEWKVEVERWRSLAQGWRKEAVDAIKDTRE
jgi:hypothetical protein